MSMHEFESAADEIVSTLDRSPRSHELDLRSMFASLARFVESWDAAFQHFHVLGPLLRHRFTYVLPVQEHPDYAQHRAYFDSLTGYANICRHPGQPWDADHNPETAMFCNPSQAWKNYTENIPPHLVEAGMLYFDAGGELWQRLADAGKLTGQDALPPRDIPLEEVVHTALQESRQISDDTRIISIWYPLMMAYAMLHAPRADTFIHNPYFIAIRELVIAVKAYEYDHDYGYTRLPSPEELENPEHWEDTKEPALHRFFEWWFEPLRAYYHNRDQDPAYWHRQGRETLELIFRQRYSTGSLASDAGRIYRQLPAALQQKLPLSWMPSLPHVETTWWEQHFSPEELTALQPLMRYMLLLSKHLLDKAQLGMNYFTKALDLDPGNWKSRYNRGRCYLELLQPAPALADFESVITQEPENDHGYLGKGLALLMMARQQEARTAFEQALARNPDNQEAKAYLGIIKN